MSRISVYHIHLLDADVGWQIDAYFSSNPTNQDRLNEINRWLGDVIRTDRINKFVERFLNTTATEVELISNDTIQSRSDVLVKPSTSTSPSLNSNPPITSPDELDQ